MQAHLGPHPLRQRTHHLDRRSRLLETLDDALDGGPAERRHIVGVQVGAAFAGFSTVTKFGALVFLSLAAFAMGGGSNGAAWSHLASNGAPIDWAVFGLALISVMWAYDGFADLSFASGEVKDPQRNLPRAIIGGTLAIIAIYVLVNTAYLYVSPIEVMAKSPLIAADTMAALFGRMGASFVSVTFSRCSRSSGRMTKRPLPNTVPTVDGNPHGLDCPFSLMKRFTA